MISDTSMRRGVALGATSVLALSSLTIAAHAATVTSTPLAAMPTSTWSPPSSDPSGIAFIPGQGLLVSDAEIEEAAFTAPITHSNNLFTSDLAGNRTGGGSTIGWSNEPTGVAYVAAPGSPWNGHLFVTDDDRKEVIDISSAGADGRFGTADDGSRIAFKTSPFGNTDPEDVAFDPIRNELWIAGGLSTIVSRVNPGADNRFDTAADNVTSNFQIPHVDPDPLKVPSPEGMAWDPERQTVYILDGESQMMFEFARNGAELNRIDLTPIDMQSPGGVTIDPASSGPSRTFYVADRGLDPNGTRPASCPAGSSPDCEAFNDGMIHKVQVTMPAIGNRPPLANAGGDLVADTQETVTLFGSGEDGDSPPSPGPLTYQWSRVSGPGSFTLGTPNAPTTTATFTRAGVQTMRLTVRDGTSGAALADFDDMIVNVFAPGAPRTVDVPIRVGDDDAQESIGGTSDGFTDLQSGDNELGNTTGVDTTKVMTGLRFTDLPIPRNSTIDNARVQFSVDEVGSSPASYVVQGHLTGNAPPFLHGNNATTGSKKNISSRPPTAASVAWNNVPAWTTVRAEGPDQATPQLAPILQEIVNQGSWARGNAAVFTFINAPGNTGRRTAEAKDGRIPPYLRITYRTPLPNVAPVVDAGSSPTVTFPGLATLAGTVADDGKPGPVSTTWSKVSGPGTVAFADATALSTTASFSAAGKYTLRLTATDGALSASDTVTVTVKSPPKNGG
jgi:hypothetical protein